MLEKFVSGGTATLVPIALLSVIVILFVIMVILLLRSGSKRVRAAPKRATEARSKRAGGRPPKSNHSVAINIEVPAIKIMNNKGLGCYIKGQRTEAIAIFDSAIQLDPKDHVLFNNRGLAYYSKGMHDEACLDFDNAIAIHPVTIAAYNNRGLVRLAQGSYDLAILDFEKAIEVDTRLGVPLNNRGCAYLRKKNLVQAYADFEAAIALNPGYGTAYANRHIVIAADIADRAIGFVPSDNTQLDGGTVTPMPLEHDEDSEHPVARSPSGRMIRHTQWNNRKSRLERESS